MKVEFLKDWHGTLKGAELDMIDCPITHDLILRGICKAVADDDAIELVKGRATIKKQKKVIDDLKKELAKQQRPVKDKMVNGARNKMVEKVKNK